jgi:hypothetical protein
VSVTGTSYQLLLRISFTAASTTNQVVCSLQSSLFITCPPCGSPPPEASLLLISNAVDFHHLKLPFSPSPMLSSFFSIGYSSSSYQCSHQASPLMLVFIFQSSYLIKSSLLIVTRSFILPQSSKLFLRLLYHPCPSRSNEIPPLSLEAIPNG